MMDFEKLGLAFKQLLETLEKVNQLFAFVDELPACDGCGRPTAYKTLNSPITGMEIWICEDCWNEFMNQGEMRK